MLTNTDYQIGPKRNALALRHLSPERRVANAES